MMRGDLLAATAILNHWIRTSTTNMHLEEIPLGERERWFATLGGRHRAVVADADGTVAGFAYSGALRPRAGFDASVETTVYLDPAHLGRGLGSDLYAALFALLAPEDIHRLYAVLSLPNPASVALHARFGFRRAAVFGEQGRKFGQWWDIAWYEREWPPG